MSETKHHKGTLTPIKIIKDLEHTAFLILQDELRYTMNMQYYSTYCEALDDVGYDSFIVINDIIYRICNMDIDVADDIMNASINPDGSIDYEVKYYNGGCSFGEALEISINRIKTKEE